MNILNIEITKKLIVNAIKVCEKGINKENKKYNNYKTFISWNKEVSATRILVAFQNGVTNIQCYVPCINNDNNVIEIGEIEIDFSILKTLIDMQSDKVSMVCNIDNNTMEMDMKINNQPLQSIHRKHSDNLSLIDMLKYDEEQYVYTMPLYRMIDNIKAHEKYMAEKNYNNNNMFKVMCIRNNNLYSLDGHKICITDTTNYVDEIPQKEVLVPDYMLDIIKPISMIDKYNAECTIYSNDKNILASISEVSESIIDNQYIIECRQYELTKYFDVEKMISTDTNSFTLSKDIIKPLITYCKTVIKLLKKDRVPIIFSISNDRGLYVYETKQNTSMDMVSYNDNMKDYVGMLYAFNPQFIIDILETYNNEKESCDIVIEFYKNNIITSIKKNTDSVKAPLLISTNNHKNLILPVNVK